MWGHRSTARALFCFLPCSVLGGTVLIEGVVSCLSFFFRSFATPCFRFWEEGAPTTNRRRASERARHLVVQPLETRQLSDPAGILALIALPSREASPLKSIMNHYFCRNRRTSVQDHNQEQQQQQTYDRRYESASASTTPTLLAPSNNAPSADSSLVRFDQIAAATGRHSPSHHSQALPTTTRPQRPSLPHQPLSAPPTVVSGGYRHPNMDTDDFFQYSQQQPPPHHHHHHQQEEADYRSLSFPPSQQPYSDSYLSTTHAGSSSSSGAGPASAGAVYTNELSMPPSEYERRSPLGSAGTSASTNTTTTTTAASDAPTTSASTTDGLFPPMPRPGAEFGGWWCLLPSFAHKAHFESHACCINAMQAQTIMPKTLKKKREESMSRQILWWRSANRC